PHAVTHPRETPSRLTNGPGSRPSPSTAHAEATRSALGLDERTRDQTTLAGRRDALSALTGQPVRRQHEERGARELACTSSPSSTWKPLASSTSTGADSHHTNAAGPPRPTRAATVGQHEGLGTTHAWAEVSRAPHGTMSPGGSQSCPADGRALCHVSVVRAHRGCTYMCRVSTVVVKTAGG